MEPEIAVNNRNLELFRPIQVSRNFTALWIGQSLANLGSAVLNVVLPIIALSLGGSTLTIGWMMTLLMIPQVILLPFSGILADRLPRVPMMIITDSVRFILLGIVTFLAAMNRMTLMDLYLFAILFGAMQALFQPAYAATRAQIFTKDIRNAANALTQASQQLAMTLGPSLGGLIVGFSSGAFGLGVNALGFLVSTLSLMYVKVPVPVMEQSDTPQPKTKIFQKLRNELLSGYFELRKHDWLWVTILAFSFINILGRGMIVVVLPWLINIHLNFPSYIFGIVSSAAAVGALVMSFLFGSRRTWKHRGILAYLGVAISAAALVCLTFASWIPMIVVIMAIHGAGYMLFGLIWEVSLQELVPHEAYGRVVSLDIFGSIALLPLGYILTGWLAENIGGLWTIGISSALVLIIVAFALSFPAIRKFE
ncbi:MFS transporter [Paenibacillus sp. GP183]|uniref:MFS transporter n=1 Tax=Paenibacillus sp. GP183 TaxID=1882751 RepID=UPI000897DFDA|nr:MFS transporter [Paenibacillus sp. GP183]SEC27606.1 Predicted arabinose efflux permease, MFS family [Paenibacillus sp. GP183]